MPVPYVFFAGQCRAALTRYAEIFGHAPELMEASGMPGDFPVPEGREDWIMHGSIKIQDGMLMASDDVFAETKEMSGCSVMLDYPTAAEARGIFDQLADGGQITMAFEPTFWSAGFGTCVDRFGIRWMVGTSEQPSEG